MAESTTKMRLQPRKRTRVEPLPRKAKDKVHSCMHEYTYKNVMKCHRHNVHIQ